MTEMLLTRSARWRSAIAQRDPRAAARATPTDAPEAERRSAAWLLWNRAQSLDVWIDPNRLQSSRSDGDVVSALIRAGGLSDLKTEVRAGVSHGSRFQRGNAIDVIAGARMTGAERLLRRVLVDDDDPVLARSAAGAARRLGLRSLLGAIERRALSSADNSEVEDLTWAALQLAPSGERLALALRLAGTEDRSLREWTLLGALKPAEQLNWLAIRARAQGEHWEASYGVERLEQLIAELGRPTRRQAAQVALVAAVARQSSPAIIEFLGNNPAGAVGLIDAVDEELVAAWEIVPLLRAVPVATLDRHGARAELLELLSPAEPLAEVPLPVGRDRRPAFRPLAHRQSLTEILAIERREDLLTALHETQALGRQVAEAPAAEKQRLIDKLDGLWSERDLREAVRVSGNEANIEAWAEAVMRLGPLLQWRLSERRWAQAALSGWLFQPQLAWLADQAGTQGVYRALRDDPSGRSLADLIAVVPATDLDVVVQALIERTPGALTEVHDAKLEAVAGRLSSDRPELLAELAEREPSIELLAAPYLAQAGNLDVQRRLLRQADHITSRRRAHQPPRQ